jgi:hypothetical protein
MRSFLILTVFLSILYTGCTPAVPERLEQHDLIPPSCSAVLKINDSEQFRSDFRNSAILKSIMDNDPKQNAWLQSVEEVLELEPPSGSLLVLGSGSEDWLLILPDYIGMADTTQTDTLSQKSEIATDRLSPFPDSSGVQYRKHNNLEVLASSAGYLRQALSNPVAPSGGLTRSLKASNPLAEATLFLPPEAPNPLTGAVNYSESETDASGLAWAAYDLLSNPGSFSLQGFEALQDSTASIGQLLRSQPILPLQEAAALIPESTSTWLSYALQMPTLFRVNQKNVTGKANPNSQVPEYVEQLSIAETKEGVLVVLHGVNTNGMEEIMMPLRGGSSEFQGTLIYSIRKSGLIRESFAPLLDEVADPAYYCTLGDSFLFSLTPDPIQSAISDYNRKSAFDNSRIFKQLNPILSSESSTLLISEAAGESVILKDAVTYELLPAKLREALPANFMVATQLNLENNYTLSSYQMCSAAMPRSERAAVGEVFTTTLDAPVLSTPQFLKNHREGGMDIAVQDENHVLYLFSKTGKLFWKKELPGPVQGRIHQVDLFRNGRLQMAFSTDSQLIVLDRDGKEVAPFPKKFRGGNLGPLAVFDYENNRNYRLVVTQGPRVFMFNGQGRDVKGFKFRDAGSPVVSVPAHIRIGSRDYLVFQLENGNLRILNRVGDRRVSVKETFEFSNNPVLLYRNGFAFTERNGDLIRIDTRGRISRTPLNLSPDHGMDATTKTMALMDDNRFQVKTNKQELELGVYTRPRIFYLNDIIYVAVTDIQSQQIHLFRSTGLSVPGFPVEGSGSSDMADMDKDRNPEVVVPYRKNSIRVYRVNR